MDDAAHQLEPSGSLVITCATPDDAADAAHVRASASPYLVLSAAGMRHRLAEPQTAGSWIGRVGGTAVAFATRRHVREGRSRLSVLVVPRAQRHGHGSRLLAAVAADAEQAGATQLFSVADGSGGIAFAQRHGWEVGRVHRFSTVDLTAPSADAAARPVGLPGVEVVPLTEVDPYAVWRLHDTTIRDDPSGMAVPQPFEEWRHEDWDFVDHAPDLGVGVLEGDELVAFTQVFGDRARGTVWTAMTGVRPDRRGRGLARLVKTASLDAARAAGMTRASTANDAANAPMVAVNTALGYRLAAEATSVSRQLA